MFNWEDYLRLAIAMLLGASIGFERELHGKPAGLKTIALVSLAGCLLAIMSVRLGDIAPGGADKVDIARLAAGVLTGIGFIGAGTIIQSRHHVEGITTAAVIWLMSAVGMALGAGFYGIAFAAYVLGWVSISLDPIGAWIMHTFNLRTHVVRGEEREHALEYPAPFGTEWPEEVADEREEAKPLKPPFSQTSIQDRETRKQ